MADIPEGAEWGIVVGRFGAIRSDSDDPDRVPDVAPLSGTVTLTPAVEWVQLAGITGAGRFHVDTLVCPVVDGILYAPDNSGDAGVPLLATEQPAGIPARVQWTASFDLEGVTSQPVPVVFDVPGGGQEVDLAAQIGAEEESPYVVLVSTEDRVLAQEAAQAARASQIAAGGSAAQASADRASAEQAAIDAQAAQTAAEQAAAEAEAGDVESVNGKTGEVILTPADLGAAETEHSHSIADVISLQEVLDGISASVGQASTNPVTVPAFSSVQAMVHRDGNLCHLTGTVSTDPTTGVGDITAGTPVVLWSSASNPMPAGYAPSAPGVGMFVANTVSPTAANGVVRLSGSSGIWSLTLVPAVSMSGRTLTLQFNVTYLTNDPLPG